MINIVIANILATEIKVALKGLGLEDNAQFTPMCESIAMYVTNTLLTKGEQAMQNNPITDLVGGLLNNLQMQQDPLALLVGELQSGQAQEVEHQAFPQDKVASLLNEMFAAR